MQTARHDELHEAAMGGGACRPRSSSRGGAYAFLHDRVQEAAYALIPSEQRAAIHLRIGRRLLAALDDTEIDAQIFEVASQFNRGDASLEPTGERARLPRSICAPGAKAKASAAYAAACGYLAEGMALLGRGWLEPHATSSHSPWRSSMPNARS